VIANIPDPDAFRGAADVIRENGWYQGEYYWPTDDLPPAKCPVCVLGAVLVATVGVPQHLHDEDEGCDETCFPLQWLATFMSRSGYCDSDVLGIADWNDESERTVDEVLDLLERAAKAAESARAEAAQDGGES
jgi:hypothetical protein